MAKQPETFIQYTMQFVKDFNSFPFEDYYVFLVMRFMVYIYLFIKLSDILLGYQKPNLKTRVLRKFQFVYGEQILRELDKDDIQELQITITNTILNATKELSTKNHQLTGSSAALRHSPYTSTKYQSEGNKSVKMYESQRRQLRHQDSLDSSLSHISKKSLKLKFDLDKNQYFDPPSSTQSSLITLTEKQEEAEFSKGNFINCEEEVEGQSEEENLSPKKQRRPEDQKQKNFKKTQIKSKPKAKRIHLTSKKQQTISSMSKHQQSILDPNQADAHYPQKQLQGIKPELEENLIKTEENLLNLSDEDLNASLRGDQPEKSFQKNHSERTHSEQNINFPSIIKTESTKITDTLVQQLDT